MRIETSWVQDMKFRSRGDSEYEIIMDSVEDNGEEVQGAKPMELLLHGVAGCTGIDIIMILKKMRVAVNNFKIKVDGKRAPEHPGKFINIHLQYIIKGEGVTEKKVKRAIELSLDKYCSASNSLTADISYSYEIND